MTENRLLPIHPGEVLAEEFLTPMGLSQNKLAMDIHVSARRINEIVQGKRRITADTALRLARYFGMSPQFWLGLQMDYDLDVTSDELADRLDKEVRIATNSQVDYLDRRSKPLHAGNVMVLVDWTFDKHGYIKAYR